MKFLEFMLLLQKYYLVFTVSFNAFPALKAGVFLTSNEPKPSSCTCLHFVVHTEWTLILHLLQDFLVAFLVQLVLRLV